MITFTGWANAMEINYKFTDVFIWEALIQKSLKVLYNNKKGKDVCLQHESFNAAKIYHKFIYFFLFTTKYNAYWN